MYKRIVKPLLFFLPPERAHQFAMASVRVITRIPFGSACLRLLWGVPKKMPTLELWDLPFKGYVGLAAGFDKRGDLLDGAKNLGFSFVEIGTITHKPQPGNPKPRLFRLPKDKALINRMGFNSPGVDYVEKRLAKMRCHHIPIIGNIGKNSTTANHEAWRDYLLVFERLYPLVDLFVINVSCPNVKSLCELQSDDSIASLLQPLIDYRRQQGIYRPILLKLGPDSPMESVTRVVHTAQRLGVDAFVASNTTNGREGLMTDVAKIGNGGLSGTPLHERALALVKTIRENTPPRTPIIGVGGISNGEEALAMLKAGASLVEVFSGFIYEGPALARRINRYLLQHQDEIPNWLGSDQ